MEKIKVNMSPNPLDVQTIHASQNDGEARQWEFELHNNGELIDTSEITEQMVFKSYNGGTEQILPENGSTPTTSPFNGDIKYPQGLLTDQEFLYRESPAEEDGLAKITDIKGNTLVWNQLVQNGNFTSTSGWNPTRGTITANNNICQFTATETGSLPQSNRINNANITPLANHTYLLSAYIKAPRNTVGSIGFTQIDYWPSFNLQTNVKTKVSTIYTFSNVSSNINLGIGVQANANDVIEISNVQMFDLTQMGLDISSPSDFTSLFPLSYYAYNQGTLLSFNGNGIKTTGKNKLLFANGTRTGTGITGTVSDGVFSATGTATSTYANLNFFNTIDFIENGKQYTVGLNAPIGYSIVFRFATYTTDTTYQQVTVSANSQFTTFTANNDFKYVRLYISSLTSGTVVNISNMIPIIANGQIDTFEPYHTETTTLPISTYFPTGMKSAVTVYDELTPSKAITRIGMVNLGDLNWTYSTNAGHERFNVAIPDARKPLTANDKANLICAIYENSTNNETFSHVKDKTIAIGNTGQIYVYDSAYTSASAFKSAMANVYLFYELATPTETSFTTASLVTENAEIPLSNEDGVLIGKCTEQLSSESGFFDAKIKLADGDGECYSNKIQLHVERSPQ